MNEEPEDKKSLRQRLKETIDEIKKVGGWDAFKSGDWLLNLIKQSFRAYYDNANAGYFRTKYPRASEDEIIKKLTSVAARNAGLLGAVTGASVSANEIAAIVTSAPAGGLNLPAQITIAGSALAAEAILLVRIQLQLIASIAKLLDVPLDPDDPEDVLLVLGLAVGGVGAEALGKFGAKAAGHVTKSFIRKKISGATLEAIKRFASRLGFKILQRSIIKYAVPGASILVGGGWNFFTTRGVAKVATRHFRSSREDRRKNATDNEAPKGEGKHLRLSISCEQFDAIRQGKVKVMHRDRSPYWIKRIEGRLFSEVHLSNGRKGDTRTMRVQCRSISTEGEGKAMRYAITLGSILETKGC